MDFSRFSADLALGHLTLRRRALYPAELMALIWDCSAQGECTSSHLGGDRSILLSYRCLYEVGTPEAPVSASP